MSTPPSDLPPPPTGQTPASTPTQIVGQQAEPASTVPHAPPGALANPPSTQTNTLAVVSLVAGIGSFVAHIIPGAGGFTVALVAVITGYIARNQIKQTGERGMGMATAGIIIGLVHLGLIVLVVVILIVAIFALGITLFGISRH
ncbi:MAG: hypothetical protein AUH69_05035 [Actinobacteria bacterium 13_1_40CM_4_65_12]|nr:MAG: hypothetical protein AUH40_01185 [Chloroflexi bacterium 13_1_40CM_65_17]OLC67218.1 MAG: hypothetical protein AUH69_05035 [Actinobacteria bacterium 13_1_40CM_4_65_12]